MEYLINTSTDDFKTYLFKEPRDTYFASGIIIITAALFALYLSYEVCRYYMKKQRSDRMRGSRIINNKAEWFGADSGADGCAHDVINVV